MPYRLVHELQKLMTMRFEASPKALLGSADTALPDEVFEQVDLIAHVAKQTFGTRIQPTQQQEHILKSSGFPVSPGKTDMVGWKSGQIVTPRGIIHYP